MAQKMTDNQTIIPVILSGGAGTRLWPVSRKTKPKQFLRFGSEHSLFQQTVLRCCDEVFSPRPIIVGGDLHRFLIAEDLAGIDRQADILLEPVGRNSCPAIAIACFSALERNADALVLVLAADHAIPDEKAFTQTVLDASQDANEGSLVTFGIEPREAATGYGYIKPGAPLNAACKVEAFVEKPDRKTAENYVRAGYLWNSGNFLFSARHFLDELKSYQPEMLELAKHAYDKRVSDLDFQRLDRDAFSALASISVDYAVMEKTTKAAVLPVSYFWSDIGSWGALAATLDCDVKGNVIIGDGVVQNANGNIIHSDKCLTAVCGVDDLVVVSTRDAVMVTHKDQTENVKSLVAILNQNDRSEANESLQVFRPWGNYERLDEGVNYQVKRIVVKPGGVLSLQKHKHRSEHWIVVEGSIDVTIGNKTMTVSENQSVYIPKETVHRLTNTTQKPVSLIEVQSGSYLGEDDIVRLEDVYNRGEKYDGI